MRHSLLSYASLLTAVPLLLVACGGTESAPAGHCGPEITAIVTGVVAPSFIAVDTMNVYWTTGDLNYTKTTPYMMKAPLGGGAATVLVPKASLPASATFGEIAVGDGGLYFVEDSGMPGGLGGLMKVPIDGGAVVARVATVFTNKSIASDAADVYWIHGSSITKTPLAGGPSAVLAQGENPFSVVVTAQRLVWVESHESQSSATWEDVHSMRLTGGVPVVLSGKLVVAARLAASSDHAYWVEEDGLIRRAPLEGGPTVTLEAAPPATAGYIDWMRVDGAAVYLLRRKHGVGESELSWALGKLPLAGGAEKTLASGTSTRPYEAPGVGDLTMDEECLYWTDAGADGRIFSLAKTAAAINP